MNQVNLVPVHTAKKMPSERTENIIKERLDNDSSFNWGEAKD
jgi:hypothetical protein